MKSEVLSSSSKVPTIFLISLGRLNGLVLRLLAREAWVGEIVVATRDPERTAPPVNLARMSAAAGDVFPRIRLLPLDFNHTEKAAEVLAALRPDVTLAAPSLHSWWVLETLPEAAAARLRPAGFGAWLPCQLAPMIRLMRAWKMSGVSTPIVSAPYPDAVNPILEAHDLAPTCGCGNLDEMVPKVRWLAAERAGVHPEAVRVHLAAHHALERFVYSDARSADEQPPFLLRVEIDGRLLGAGESAALLLEPLRLPLDLDFQFLTAASILRLLRALTAGAGIETYLHVPAPAGLPGGYPVRIRGGQVHLDLPSEWTPEAAVEVNERSHRWDGIERIDGQGNVYMTERAAGILREVLGYDRSRLAFEEAEDAAHELIRRFGQFASQSRP